MDPTAKPPSVEDVIAQVGDLATLPDVYARIRQALDDTNSTHADLAEIISTDPAVAARLLKIANSAFYGRSGTIARVSQAVGLLGTQQVHDLVLATVVIAGTRDLLGDPSSLRTFWRLSITIASSARLIAEECGILDSERMFVAGLISQLGHQVLQHALPDQSAHCRQQAELSGTDLATEQRRQLGFDHTQVAAALFADWNFPSELIAPIRWQAQPAEAGERILEASILHVAHAQAVGLLDESTLEEVLKGIDDTAWQTVEMTREQLSAVADAALALTEELAPILLDVAA